MYIYIYIYIYMCVCVCRTASLWPKLRNSFGNLVSVNKRLVPISSKTKLLRSYDR